MIRLLWGSGRDRGGLLKGSGRDRWSVKMND